MNASIEKYLRSYNIVQLIGWSVALLFLFISVDIAFCVIAAYQLLSLVEIYHAQKKWNAASPLFCFLQIFARLLIIYLVLKVELSCGGTLFIHTFNGFVLIMFFAWCIAEVIRYAYYISELLHKQNSVLTWWRYSAFIVCYPVGLICEIYILLCVHHLSALPQVKLFVVLVLIGYAIAFPTLYIHLLKQRKKKLYHRVSQRSSV